MPAAAPYRLYGKLLAASSQLPMNFETIGRKIITGILYLKTIYDNID